MAITLEIDGVAIAHMPMEFKCTIQDLDYNNSSGFGRAIDGTLSRNRIAVKRGLELKYGPLPWATISTLLQQMADEFFEVTYPDIYTGAYETKTFYVSDRPAGIVKTPLNQGGNITWGAMTFKLIEK